MYVDMGTYKAEFLSHYYSRRLRPASAYALGLIPWSARVATRMPGLANAVLQAKTTGWAVKRLGGLSTTRPAPLFATEGFRRSAGARRANETVSPTVVLWPDTFSDVYEPGRISATLAVLEAAGERVAVPRAWGCCGRPLYDMGMLNLARRTLRQVLDIVESWVNLGLPVVVPEPSCLATFKDELPKLLADDPRALSLSHSARSLSEHLLAIGWRPERLAGGRRVLLHPHCHQRATTGTDADRAVLERAGFEVEILDAGCCGLAGSFGFRADHDAISRAHRRDEVPALPCTTSIPMWHSSSTVSAAGSRPGTSRCALGDEPRRAAGRVFSEGP